jgi:hypothetical protein
VKQAEHLWLSIDEHTVARLTRRVLIPKGFHHLSSPLPATAGALGEARGHLLGHAPPGPGNFHLISCTG